jgi:hypothetical protein
MVNEAEHALHGAPLYDWTEENEHTQVSSTAIGVSVAGERGDSVQEISQKDGPRKQPEPAVAQMDAQTYFSEGGNWLLELPDKSDRDVTAIWSRHTSLALTFKTSKDAILAICVFLLPMVYGGIHLAAWNFEFPSTVENIMWKVAAISISLGFPLFQLTHPIFTWIVDYADQEGLSKWKKEVLEMIGITTALLVWVTLVAMPYFAGRSFLVVEAFISLRAAPIGVYKSPAWVEMIPHL